MTSSTTSNMTTVASASTCSQDSRSFTAITSPARQQDENGTSYVVSVLGNDLRVGKFVMMNGHPCKIRELHRAAPGKHGHAKLRTVGIDIFDSKKREAIFVSQQSVSVPLVQVHHDVRYRVDMTENKVLEFVSLGHAVTGEDDDDARHANFSQLPATLAFEQEEEDIVNAAAAKLSGDSTLIMKEGQHVLITVVQSCGYHKVKTIRLAEPAEQQLHNTDRVVKESVVAESSFLSSSMVLSKKEQRKRKKQELRNKKKAANDANQNGEEGESSEVMVGNE